MFEFALATPSYDIFGICRNPWNLERGTGGSSSGSGAGVSASLCVAALGTDTGGSIRSPASYCGVVGLKPSNGRVSCYGVSPLSWTLDTVGPLAKTVEDVAIMLQAIAGVDPLDVACSKSSPPDYLANLGEDIHGLRIAVPKEYFEGCDDEIEKAVRNGLGVLETEGAQIERGLDTLAKVC